MKNKMLLVFILAIFSTAGSSAIKPVTNFENVTINRVYDGDTIFVDIPEAHPFFGENISVRINGIDTPELRTKNPCEKAKAIEAKKLVYDLIGKSKQVSLRNAKKGKYFRIVADVWADDASIADQLIKAKLAYPYFGKTKQKIDWCK